ncbi:MAG TPA: hypothetical protein VJB06_00460 [archaeon]|nr:hypothetical protein [archaeon]
MNSRYADASIFKSPTHTINMELKKWIEVEGKMMDAVEFTRFIRQKSAPKVRKMFEEAIEQEHANNLKLKRLQELA